jgi:Ca2+-binding EF-hand superfamily protein
MLQERKILPLAASIAGSSDRRGRKKPMFYGVFRDGTAFADPCAGKFKGRHAALVGVFAMLLAIGAVSSALDALQSLTSSKSSASQTTGFNQTSTNPFDLGTSASPGSSNPATGAGGFSQLSPAMMSALLAAQSQPSTATTPSAPTSPSAALQDLFSQLDANGDGRISKSEFENALGAGGTNIAQADDVFNKLDKNGDGSVSLDELSSALKGAAGKGHHHHHIAGSDGSSGTGGSSSDPLLQALSGASSTSVTNSDGSTTTSVTYADGSKVTMTSPAAATSSGSATSSYNIIEQMIAREAQAISASAATSLSVSV